MFGKHDIEIPLPPREKPALGVKLREANLKLRVEETLGSGVMHRTMEMCNPSQPCIDLGKRCLKMISE